MFGAIAGGIASALAGGAMSKLFGGGQKAASGGIQGEKGIKDECSRLLEASTMKSRRGFAIQRLMNAMRQAHADGWFIVFDTLTLADDRLEAFYDNPNALRDYFR